MQCCMRNRRTSFSNVSSADADGPPIRERTISSDAENKLLFIMPRCSVRITAAGPCAPWYLKYSPPVLGPGQRLCVVFPALRPATCPSPRTPRAGLRASDHEVHQLQTAEEALPDVVPLALGH